ncbi:MAG: hypothetical protein WCK35_13440, partial [Chloroflexota bacterium]
MTDPLELPKIFKGTWDHLLILTYGADLPFFENAILRSDFRCPNKVILADGQKFLLACERYARDGLVHSTNQHYVADGVYTSNAVHAKIILLTSQDKGKLLVGSGNLGAQGYTSGGEMFTLYEYNDEHRETLSAFQMVWAMLDTLMTRGLIGGAALRYVQAIYEDTPWLMHIPINDEQPVRHNLDHSFLEQLREAVGDEPVQEMWVMAPFYDEKAIALSRLVETFYPVKVNLVLQPKHVSMDKAALQKVLDRFPGRILVHPFYDLESGQTAYVHAKFYLLKTKTHAVCLQGSPNCSQVALLLPSPQGNIEAANLLIGARDSFDSLLNNLNLQPALTDLDGLDVNYVRPDPSTNPVTQPWLLTGVQWQGDALYLYFHGPAPLLEFVQLHIGQAVFGLTAIEAQGNRFHALLAPEAQRCLAQGIMPVALEISGHLSAWLFPQNLEMLERETQMAHADISTRDLQNFDPEDPEFESILRELEAAIPLDRRSIWQLAGRPQPQAATDENDEAYKLSYADIDYDRLRQHPKILQYSHAYGLAGAAGIGPTRLQQILSAITDHFQGLVDVAYGRQPVVKLLANDDPEAEDDPGKDIDTPETDQPRAPINRSRVGGIIKHFIRRYLRGIQSPDFLELVGPDVVINNYIIFSHLLWRLFQKIDWLGQDFIMQAFLTMWTFIWGTQDSAGYLAELGDEARQRSLDKIGNKKNPALLLAALFYMNFECMKNGGETTRYKLRDFWRHILTKQPFDMDAYMISDAWAFLQEVMPYNLPSPGRIVVDLQALAKVESQFQFLRSLEKRFGWAEDSCRVEQANLSQMDLAKNARVEILRINSPQALSNLEEAKSVLHAWVQSGNRTYHRIDSGRYLVFYDLLDKIYYFRDQETHTEQPLSEFLVEQEAWVATADELGI